MEQNIMLLTFWSVATRVLGLLNDNTEDELCFNEAVESGFYSQQLRCLLVTLALNGVPARNLLKGNQNILMADFRCLQDLSDRLETLERYFRLPEPVCELMEVLILCLGNWRGDA